MRFVNYCIPFLFTICTVSQLFWNRVCTNIDNKVTKIEKAKCGYLVYAMVKTVEENQKTTTSQNTQPLTNSGKVC